VLPGLAVTVAPDVEDKPRLGAHVYALPEIAPDAVNDEVPLAQIVAAEFVIDGVGHCTLR